MPPDKTFRIRALFCLLSFLVCGCTHQRHTFDFHRKVSDVVRKDSAWTEPIEAEKGQTIEVDYFLNIHDGVWSIWLTQAPESNPMYHYTAYDASNQADHQGHIRFSAKDSGKYILHIKSEKFSGSNEVYMRLVK